MEDKIIKVKECVDITDMIYHEIVKGNYGEAFNICKEKSGILNGIIMDFLNHANFIQGIGVDVPQDIIVEQLKNLLNSIETKDANMLADCIHYEIRDTLIFYDEIIKAMIQEGISFE